MVSNDANSSSHVTLYVKITYVTAKCKETFGIWCGSDFHNDTFKTLRCLWPALVASQKPLSLVNPAASILDFSCLRWLDEHLWLSSLRTQCSRCFQSAHLPDQVSKDVAINTIFFLPLFKKSSRWVERMGVGYFYSYLNLVSSPMVHEKKSWAQSASWPERNPGSIRGRWGLFRRSRLWSGQEHSLSFQLSQCTTKGNSIPQLSK